MKIDKKHLAVGMLALGLITTAGASVTAAQGFGDREGRFEDRIERAVENGRLTQAEADEKRAMHEERAGNREAAKAAIEASDYSAFVAAVAETPREGEVDAATFARMVEAHQLREAGDHEGAQAIMEDLGFDKGPGHRGGRDK